jgi:eukaryotic-like serine/threonine-protein kinase
MVAKDSGERLDLRALLTERLTYDGEGGPLPQTVGEVLVALLDVSADVGGEASLSSADSGDPDGDFGFRYDTRHELGRGGMGQVHLALDRNLGRELAIKSLLNAQAITRKQVRRFLREARITAQLDHPSVVPVYDLGISPDGELFYTMKRVEGTSLSRILKGLRRKERRFRVEFVPNRLLRVFSSVCLAVAYAHDRGVVHRDIKPRNIMVGAYGEVMLLDWGIAQLFSERDLPEVVLDPAAELPPPGTAVGTPGYIAPERIMGVTALDPRSDLYSLGCVLYEILTQQRLWTERGPKNIMRATVRKDPISPSERAPGLRAAEDLEQLCMACLSRDPARRPASARAVAEAIDDYLQGSQRREETEKRVKQGRTALNRHLRLRDRVHRAEELTDEIQRRFEPWRPIVEKAAMLDGMRTLEQLRQSASDAYAEAITSFESALNLYPEDPDARSGLADCYWLRYEEAENRRDTREMAIIERRMGMYDDGRYAVRLTGEGAITLDTQPTHAEVICLEYQRRNQRLAAVPYAEMGRTPLRLMSLPRGSYLLIFRAAGHRITRYPLEIRRREHYHPSHPIKMLPRGAVSQAFVHVPAGRFRSGGDPDCPSAHSSREGSPSDFLIGRFPVTAGEYLEFLTDLQRRDPDEARRHAPGQTGVEGSFWERYEGRWSLPSVDRAENRWAPNHPVYGVSWDDAAAYCHWRSAREGVDFSLPTEWQWEKAARGVDGRFHPWGDWFDPSLCSMRESGPGRPCNRPVGLFSEDASPYRVADLSGGVQEWCQDWYDSEAGLRALRGGAWLLDRRFCRLANRQGVSPWSKGMTTGFRLVRQTGH